MNRKVPILLLILFSLFACRRNEFKVDVDNIEVEIKINRLEKEMFEISPDSLITSIPYIEKKFGSFYELFNYLINIGITKSSYYPRYLKSFVADPLNREVYKVAIDEFPEIEDIERGLTDAFKHFRYYFNDRDIPDIYTFISGFNASIIIDTNIIGIGLDRYLGSESEYFDKLGIPEYQQYNMQRGKIVTDCLHSFISTEWPFNKEGDREITNNVLNNIIHEGKIIYCVKSMVPSENIGFIMGFSPDEYKFCRNNEKQMWTYLIENKLLYKSDRMTVKKLIDKAPFTSYFPRESPGRAAVWLGYKIVKEFMERNRDTTLDELMEITDYQDILERANYNPRNKN